jgi:ABC-type bacteriocin/lantibiotic exporter with double-glycine peptidase domain
MIDEYRASMIGGLWFFSALVLGALFISAGAQGELTPGHILLALIILGLAVTGTLALWYGGGQAQQAKAKRQRLDNLLNTLSEEELIALKERLADSDHQEKTMLDLDDDGELVWRR